MAIFKKIIDMVNERMAFARPPDKGVFDITPYRDWRFLVVLMILIGISLIALSAYLFVVINTDESVEIEAVGIISSEPIDTQQLREALELFSEKEKTFQELLNFPSRVIDPSL